MLKKIAVFICVVSCVFCMATCFAASTGQAEFVSQISTGLSPDALWGAVTPFATLIIGLILFAFGYRMFAKTGKGYSKGKAKF